MKPIVFNFNDSLLDRIVEAISIKAGYLLGDEIYTAGNTAMELLVREYILRYSAQQKLELLERRFRDDAEMYTMVKEMKQLQKISSKVKYKTSEQIALDRRMEKDINDWCIQVLDEMDEVMDTFGFNALRHLEKDVFKHYLIDVSSEKIYPGMSVASDILQRVLPNIKEDEEPEIFFLGSEFFSDDYKSPSLYMANDKTALDIQNTCLYRCFTLPDFTSLSAEELRMLRKHLHPAGASFREAMNEWIDMCYFGDEIMDRIEFFKNEVVAAAAALQECIDGKETQQLCKKAVFNTEKIEVWIGEMPVHKIWDYYRQYEVIKDCTWTKIEKLKEDNSYANQRWPVMILNVPEHLLQLPEKDDEMEPAEEITASRKYILID